MINKEQLEKALNGEQVILESGNTAVVLADIRKHKPDSTYPIIGCILDDDGDFSVDSIITWTENGRFYCDDELDENDIVCLKSDKKHEISISHVATDISKNKEYYLVDLLKNEVIKIFINKPEKYSNSFLFSDEESAKDFLKQLTDIR